ncbi:DinB family protein [Thalassospira sp. MA62]|nr:DinB family protein [Thalassospira sp. MA62]
MPGTSFFHQARNNAWSNHRLFVVCGQLPRRELYTRHKPSMPTLIEALNHILIVDWYYLDALLDGGRGRDCLSDKIPFGSYDKLAGERRTCDARLMGFCEHLGEKEAVREVELVLEDGRKVRETVADILSHLFVHQTHHRGQVHVLLRNTAHEPPPLDEYHLECEAPFRKIGLPGLGWAGA